jgi:hypothetical protein
MLITSSCSTDRCPEEWSSLFVSILDSVLAVRLEDDDGTGKKNLLTQVR